MRLPSAAGLALMTSLGLGACAHTTGGAVDEEEQLSAELREHHRHHHRGGVTQFIAMSLDTLGEDDDQRPQVAKLQRDLDACMDPTREIEKKLVLAWADGVAAGVMDTTRLDEEITRLNSTAAAIYECSADGLNRLHSLLTPAEREVVADKVQAHWEIWRQVNDGEEAAGPGSRLASLSEELNLTTGQVDQISSALAGTFGKGSGFEAKKEAAHVLAFAAAFVFTPFDARAVNPTPNERLSAHGARRMALFYQTVTPFLQADQRTELAEHLREHASHPTTLSAN